MKIPFKLRIGTEADKNFVLSSWMRGLRQKRGGEYETTQTKKKVIIDQGHFAAFMPHDLYFQRFRPLIEHKIYPASNILVAFNPEDEDQIYGYIAYRTLGDVSVFSFCYVKQPFRKFGIARELFEVARNKTNVTTYYVPWLEHAFRKDSVVFDPFFDLDL